MYIDLPYVTTVTTNYIIIWQCNTLATLIYTLQKQADQVDEIEDKVDTVVHTARSGTVTMLQVYVYWIHNVSCFIFPQAAKYKAYMYPVAGALLGGVVGGVVGGPIGAVVGIQAASGVAGGLATGVFAGYFGGKAVQKTTKQTTSVELEKLDSKKDK